jgi:hypothetical protein
VTARHVSSFRHLGYERPVMRVTAQRWECQLINVEVLSDGVLLDLVAVDACPFDNLDLPGGWPFVIRIMGRGVDGCAAMVTAWAEDGEVISLRFGYDTTGARWLDVTAADHRLILELR